MDIPGIPLFAMLHKRMSWLNARQNVLAQNVANADTPNYGARDLKQFDFANALRASTAQERFHNHTASAPSHQRHIAIKPSTDIRGFSTENSPDIEASLNGNSVSLEGEMMKVADTQASYQIATNLYSKAVDLMRIAIGRPGQ